MHAVFNKACSSPRRVTLPRPHQSIGSKRIPIGRAVAAAVLLLLGTVAHSQTGQITRYTIDAGGGRSSGGAYVLIGTFAQPDAATSSASGYTLSGGFWNRSSILMDSVFSNGFE